MKDGWHKLYSTDVYVENGRIKRGLSSGKAVYPYKYVKGIGWTQCAGISLEAMRKRLNNETAMWR